MHRIPRFLRNFYTATAVGLLAWMTFFDANDLPSQFKNWWKLRELENEVTYYNSQIKTIRRDRKEVLGSDRLREKYAREKYLMKKPTEDIFVIVDENNEPLEK